MEEQIGELGVLRGGSNDGQAVTVDARGRGDKPARVRISGGDEYEATDEWDGSRRVYRVVSDT